MEKLIAEIFKDRELLKLIKERLEQRNENNRR